MADEAMETGGNDKFHCPETVRPIKMIAYTPGDRFGGNGNRRK